MSGQSSLRRAALTAVVGVLGVASEAWAGPPVSCRTRVRITAPSIDHVRLVGTLLRADDTSLTLWRDGRGLLEVPRSAVLHYEVCRQRGQKGKGLRIGALAGLTLAAAGAVGAARDDCQFGCFSPAATFVLGTLAFVPLGALIGVGVAREEEWEMTTLPGRVGLGVVVAPVHGGVRAAVSLRF